MTAPGHEVVFLYSGRLADDVVPADGGDFLDGSTPIRVEWRPRDDAGCDLPLYPDGVADLITR